MDKIDLIIDALEQYVNVVVSHNDPNNFRVRVKDGGEPARKALAAAREMKALKPVAFSNVSKFYKSHGEKVFIDSPDKILMAKNLKYALTPLYALDEETK
jgi:flagellar hook-associated protein FlgK